MALIQCPECGKEISDKAPACIHCGYPILAGEEQQNKPNKAIDISNPKKGRHIKRNIIILAVLGAVMIIIASIIILSGDKYTDTYDWPTKGLATLLPHPESNIGEIQWDASYGFYVYVAETSEDAFNAYVNKCSEIGFDIDYQRGKDYYFAYNADGNRIEIHYEKELMTIQIKEPATHEDEENVPSDNHQEESSYSPGSVTNTTENDSSEPHNSSSRKCAECGASASYTCTNPFSGATEYYCHTHYNEIKGFVDIITG